MATYEFVVPAGDNELFQPGAFDHEVGGMANITIGDVVVPAMVRAAEVATDGKSVRFVMEIA